MGRCIVKLTDDAGANFYLEWSSIVDAPVTYGMPLEEFHEYYREEYGESGMRDLPQRLKRVESKGCSSWIDSSAEDVISGNRAGPKETEFSREQLIEKFCHERTG